MSALDPSFRGLPLTGGSGGGPPGPTLPVTDPADLLSGSTPNVIVGTNGTGTGTLYTQAQLNYASRRREADADTIFLWEMDGTSGNLINTGTLGAAGNLTPGTTCVRNVLIPQSTIGRGIRCDGSADGGATGAVDVAVTGSVLTAIVTFYIPSWTGGDYPILVRNAGPGWSRPYVGFRVSCNNAGALATEINLVGRHLSCYRFGYGKGFYQLVSVYDGQYLRLYANGELIATSDGHVANLDLAPNGAGAGWAFATSGDGAGAPIVGLRAQVLAAAWSADRVAEEWLRTIGNWCG